MSQTKKFLYPILIIMLSCLLGTGAMIANNTPINIWIQNISVINLFTFMTIFISKFKFKLNYKSIVFISILLLLLTFLQENNVGVRRWIQLSSFSLNISMIIIPLTIIAVNNLFKNKHIVFSFISIIMISLILFFQPDASQLMGFSIAMLLCVLNNKLPKLSKIFIIVILLMLTVSSWIFLDSLQPVNYTKGILKMLGEVSIWLYILGLISIFLIPIPFLIFSSEKNKIISICLALYYWIIALFSLLGDFPVPIIGYGSSPIIGYFIVLLWHIGTINNN